MLQATLTRTMVEEGRARYWNGVTTAKQREEESTTQYGQRLLAGSVIPLSTAIEAWLGEMERKRGGHRGAAYVPLKGLPANVVAFITARSVLDSIGGAKNYGAAACLLGSLVEDEARFRWLKANVPGLFRKLEKQFGRMTNYEHKRTVIVHTMNKHKVTEGHEAPFEPWNEALRVKVGCLLIDLFEQHTQLVETVVLRMGRKTQRVIQATAKTTEWLKKFHLYHELLDPLWLPMVDKPLAWSDPFSGGYGGCVGDDLPATHLVKRRSKQWVEEKLAKADMPDVYAAVNALQNTGWKINQRVLGVLQHYWNIGRAVGALPPSDDEPLPQKPDDIATNKDSRRAWKQRAARVHQANAALRSTRIQARKLMNIAQKFANTPCFYYPYQLDFRGRVYTVPTFLTPQGSDLSRGLLLFAEGVPLWDETDAYWLAVTGANLFGKDKVPFEERVKWVEENRENILAVGRDPLAHQWWQEAGEPWQFLAWCLEWTGWKTTGSGYVSHFPCCLDGTNNGLQILSMLTRDEVAAKATNVLPNASPADIYGDVAKTATELMKAETEPKQKVHADYWLRFGIDRKTTKRPVMVLPYGGTFHSCRDYVGDWYKETAKARGEDVPDFSTLSARVHYLSTKVWEAISHSVGRPRLAMAWLQECAVVFSKLNLPLQWTAPSGFPVLQDYKETRDTRVETALGDRINTVRLKSDHPTKLSKARQKNGISPNYVHSLDAAALTKTVALSLQYGITHFCMIHDSYGTHAPKVHEMASALRTAFVSIFTDDCLTRLREEFLKQLADAGHPEIELPPVPPYGGLEVRSLYDSEFFFA